MKVRLAHLRDQGIDFAVFEANATSGHDSDREDILVHLTAKARLSGLRVIKSALAFSEGGRLKFFGTPDLVRYLSNRGVPQWTHTIDTE